MTHPLGAPASLPQVAIVVLNWNGWNDTVECLEALQQLEYPDYRIIAIDNGSSDASVARIQQWARGELPVASALVHYDTSSKPVCLAEYTSVQAEVGGVAELEAALERAPSGRALVLVTIGTNQGFAAGNNVGLRYALACGFPYVLLVNNDVMVDRDVLSQLVSCLEGRPTWAGVAPKVLQRSDPGRVLYAGGTLRLWQARAVHRGRFTPDGPRWCGTRTTEHLSACCALFRTSFLRDAGLLDEAFFFGQEDVALSCVARERGWQLGVQLDAKVVHNEGRSLESRPAASVYYYAKYRLLLLTKHGSRLQVLVGFLFLGLSRLVKFALALLRGRSHLIKAEIRGYRDFFGGRLAEYDREQARAAG